MKKKMFKIITGISSVGATLAMGTYIGCKIQKKKDEEEIQQMESKIGQLKNYIDDALYENALEKEKSDRDIIHKMNLILKNLEELENIISNPSENKTTNSNVNGLKKQRVFIKNISNKKIKWWQCHHYIFLEYSIKSFFSRISYLIIKSRYSRISGFKNIRIHFIIYYFFWFYTIHSATFWTSSVF